MNLFNLKNKKNNNVSKMVHYKPFPNIPCRIVKIDKDKLRDRQHIDSENENEMSNIEYYGEPIINPPIVNNHYAPTKYKLPGTGNKITCYQVVRTSTGPRKITWKGRYHYRYTPDKSINMTIYPNIPTSVILKISTIKGGYGYNHKFYLPIWNSIKNNFPDCRVNGKVTYSTCVFPKPVYIGGQLFKKMVNVISKEGYLIECRFYL